MTRPSRWLWATLHAVALTLALVCNGLANALPLNGLTTGELSDRYPNLFTPAGLTFSIWGLLYLGLMALVVYGFVLAASARARTPLASLRPWLALNLLANGAWIFAWHWTQVELSVVIMAVLLGSLIALHLRLGEAGDAETRADRWLVHAPISAYLGWISVATIANATTLLVDWGAPSFGAGPALVTVGVIAVAVGLAAAMLWRRRDWIYACVVAWALLGIALKRSGAEDPGSDVVAAAALISLVLVGAGVLAVAGRQLRAPAGRA